LKFIISGFKDSGIINLRIFERKRYRHTSLYKKRKIQGKQGLNFKEQHAVVYYGSFM